MKRSRIVRMALGLSCVAALAVPVAGQAGQPDSKGNGRSFYATDTQGNLVGFSADNPRQLDRSQQITGLPMGAAETRTCRRP
jgi:hypothetical protein